MRFSRAVSFPVIQKHGNDFIVLNFLKASAKAPALLDPMLRLLNTVFIHDIQR